jgi:hypothetical protein
MQGVSVNTYKQNLPFRSYLCLHMREYCNHHTRGKKQAITRTNKSYFSRTWCPSRGQVSYSTTLVASGVQVKANSLPTWRPFALQHRPNFAIRHLQNGRGCQVTSNAVSYWKGPGLESRPEDNRLYHGSSSLSSFLTRKSTGRTSNNGTVTSLQRPTLHSLGYWQRLYQKELSLARLIVAENITTSVWVTIHLDGSQNVTSRKVLTL